MKFLLISGIFLLLLFQENSTFLFKKHKTTTTSIATTTTSTTSTTSSTTTSRSSRYITKPSESANVSSGNSKKTIYSRTTLTTTKAIKIDKDDYKLIRVIDGDTVVARNLNSKKEIKIRFRCVDAPESTQSPWGSLSAKALADIIPANSEINLINSSIDLYGRTLAEIITKKGINVNKKMIELGMVLFYPFQSGCKEFQQLESQFKKNKVGVWSDPKFELPWEYRRRVGTKFNPKNSTLKQSF